MDKTAIRTSAPAPGGPALDVNGDERPRRSFRRRGPLWKALNTIASLRLTVVLFALSMVLVFCGTLAQRELGIWSVVEKYFRNYGLVWIPFRHLVFYDVPGSFPFPGGFLLGSLLMTNLLAAHAVWVINMVTAPGFHAGLLMRRSGILLLHAGLVVMMVGEVITHHYAVEGNMIIVEGGSSNFVQDARHPELVVLTPKDDATDEVVAVPGWQLKKGGRISHELLPFDVEVLSYFPNTGKPAEPEAGADNPATAGDGRFEVAVPRPEVSGTDPEQKFDYPSAYVRLTDRGGADLGTYLVSLHYFVEDRPQEVKVGGTTYELFLRFRRSYKSYTMHLKDFHHEKYPGTQTPKDYSSYVRLVDPENNEDREVRIWMNHPLRYRGETFFQSSFLEGDKGTILQVVRNPGWLMPYVSCGIVAGGMLVHFGIGLVTFLNRRAMA